MNSFLEIKGITKRFSGVTALDNVSIEFFEGEIHALCGENGAGKSTLIHILSGVYKQNKGEIIIDGQAVEIQNQLKAQALGIGTVFQERSLVNNLSIAENIFAGRQPTGKLGLIDKKKMFQQAKELMDTLELTELSPDKIVGELSPAKQQMVEIAKVLSFDARVLIFDEPTATITTAETKTLFGLIQMLRNKGVTIIYISHRLNEIFEIADRVSVLKDGKYVGTRKTSETNSDELVKMMVGRELLNEKHDKNFTDDIVLEVRDFSAKRFSDVHFVLKKQEILSFAGLVGAGRTELFRAIFGADPKQSGELYLSGIKTQITSPLKAIRAGLGYLPEDRKEQGLYLEMSIADNIYSAQINVEDNQKGFDKKEINAIAEDYKNKLNIATPDVKKLVVYLSGGNQQKVILSKWLLLNPSILIVDEPTRGVDVGAKAEIYRILRSLVKQGTSIILISSDLPEILTLSDRILTMCNGKIVGETLRGDASEELIMSYASGLQTDYKQIC